MSETDHKQLIMRTLQEYRAGAVPDNIDLWPDIQRRIKSGVRHEQQTQATRVCMPLATAAIAVLLLVLLIGGAAWLPSLLNTNANFASHTLPGDTSANSSNGLVKVSNGYTMTLYPIIADTSQIVISYTLQGPEGAPIGIVPEAVGRDVGLLILRDQQGKEYPLSGGEFPSQQVTHVSTWDTPTDVGILRFDAGQIGDAQEIGLNLDLRMVKFTPQGEVSATAPPTTLNRTDIAGPFNFEFALPVDHTRRIFAVGQAVTAKGLTLTLEQVIVTPSETRLLIDISTDDASLAADWSLLNWTVVKPLEHGIGTQNTIWLADEQRWQVQFNAKEPGHNPLLSYKGEWAFSVYDANKLTNGMRGLSDETRKGFWQYRFTPAP